MTVSQFDPAPAYPLLINGGTEIDLQFSEDATVGVTLDFVRSKVGTAFEHNTKLIDPTVTDARLDGRLWEIDVRRRGEDANDPEPVGPAQAASFTSYDVTTAYGSTAQAVLFVWSGVAVPFADDDDTLEVSVLVRLDTDDELSHWNIWVTREKGASVTIDQVNFPVLWVQGPAKPEGAESQHEAQKRTRVLTPFNAMAPSLSPTMAPNTDLWTWADNDYSAQAGYPASNQPLQFTALASVHDDGADNSYRRPLIMIAEDGNGYVKWFNYRGYNYDPSSADEGWFNFSVGHLPSFIHDVGDKRVDDDFANSYAQPYDFTLGVRFASDNGIIWYDVAAHYRDRIVAIGAMPPEIESNPSLIAPLNREPSFWMGAIQLDSFETVVGLPRYNGFADYFNTLRSVCRSAEAPLKKGWLQFQTWLLGTLQNPRRDLYQPKPFGIDDGVEEVLDREKPGGMVGIAYTRPGDLLGSLDWVYPREVGRRERDGTVGDNLDNAETFSRWWPENMTQLVKGAGFLAQYNDSFGSGPNRMSYPNAGEHPRHGGNYLNVAQRETADNMRAQLGTTDASIGTESVIESLSDKVNIQQDGVFYYPGHAQLMEETVRLSINNVPLQARHMSPPMWPVVYGGRIPSQCLLIHMGTCLLGTNSDWYPSLGRPGLNAAEFIDLMCWLHGTCWAHGNVPLLFQCQFDFEGADPLKTPSGETNKIVTQQPWGSIGTTTKDPTGAGIEVVVFLKRLFQAQERSFAGEFVQFGQMLSPLVPDYTSVDNSRQTNPVSVLDPATKVDLSRNRFWGMLPAVQAIALLTNGPLFNWHIDPSFEVPDALYQIWRSPSGIVGMVVVNWSASTATFNATFDPADYGVGTPYRIFQRNQGAAPTLLDSGLAGPRIIGNSGVVETALPTFQPHEVYVFTFEGP